MIEHLIENMLRDAFKNATDALPLAQRPVYRRFWVDDDAARPGEAETYPRVEITANPSIPRGAAGATHKDTAVEIRVATSTAADQKRATLAAVYAAVRAVLDADTYTANGANKISTVIMDGAAGTEDGEHFVTLEIEARTCGA